MNKPFFYAIRGYKNSGKTTLMTKVVKILSEKGYKVAVIKHDGHDFEPDVPGTDSRRIKDAGAYGVAVFSANRVMIHKECKGIDEQKIAEAFPEADIIMIEGLKNKDYPGYFCNYPAEPVIPAEKLVDEIIGLLSEK